MYRSYCPPWNLFRGQLITKAGREGGATAQAGARGRAAGAEQLRRKISELETEEGELRARIRQNGPRCAGLTGKRQRLVT